MASSHLLHWTMRSTRAGFIFFSLLAIVYPAPNPGPGIEQVFHKYLLSLGLSISGALPALPFCDAVIAPHSESLLGVDTLSHQKAQVKIQIYNQSKSILKEEQTMVVADWPAKAH